MNGDRFALQELLDGRPWRFEHSTFATQRELDLERAEREREAEQLLEQRRQLTERAIR